MSKSTVKRVQEKDREARREFLKKIGKGSATVPAASLLLAASMRNARATPDQSGGGGCGSGGGSILVDNTD